MSRFKREHVKTIANFVVARSVSAVVVSILHQNVATETKLQNVELYIGAYVLGSMASNAAQEHTEKTIDQVADAVTQVKTMRTNQ